MSDLYKAAEHGEKFSSVLFNDLKLDCGKSSFFLQFPTTLLFSFSFLPPLAFF